jgi:hypothetical protein
MLLAGETRHGADPVVADERAINLHDELFDRTDGFDPRGPLLLSIYRSQGVKHEPDPHTVRARG